MKLPNLEKAYIPPAKVQEYLLNPEHEKGKAKALFFEMFGFALDEWEQLAGALIVHATEHKVTKVEQTPFGIRYVVEGVLETPDRRTPNVRAVWFIPKNDERPRLVTAYPLE